MFISDEELINTEPFSISRKEKEILLLRRLNALTILHSERCGGYRRILKGFGITPGTAQTIGQIPFIPVRLFKELDLLSTTEVYRTLTSSGTSGHQASRIYLDKVGAANQSKVLVKIVGNLIGKQRMPMIVIDSESTIANRGKFSARAAGIKGFSMFGSRRLFALDDKMELRIREIVDFVEENRETGILIFGFTFMIWQHFLSVADKVGLSLDLRQGVLIHGGGWKKLTSIMVTNEVFKKESARLFGLARVHDYYGMVEQTGTIYVECELGHLHASTLSEIIIRDPVDFSAMPVGHRGIIQTISALPESYPGHSLLTDDEGMMLGEDDCKCGRLGKYFKVFGRLANAEMRGCSDTYAQQY